MAYPYSDYVDSLATHLIFFVSGATGLGIVAHAVNTFPQPKSEIGRWFLGVIQYAVGQRAKGLNTLNGHETMDVPLIKQEVPGPIRDGPTKIVVIQGQQATPDKPEQKG